LAGTSRVGHLVRIARSAKLPSTEWTISNELQYCHGWYQNIEK
jgi:hypothetical protein